MWDLSWARTGHFGQRTRGTKARRQDEAWCIHSREINREASGADSTQVNMEDTAWHADDLRLYPVCNWEPEES